MTRENGHAEALDSGLVTFQIEALSKKYAKNTASFVRMSRANFECQV